MRFAGRKHGWVSSGRQTSCQSDLTRDFRHITEVILRLAAGHSLRKHYSLQAIDAWLRTARTRLKALGPSRGHFSFTPVCCNLFASACAFVFADLRAACCSAGYMLGGWFTVASVDPGQGHRVDIQAHCLAQTLTQLAKRTMLLCSSPRPSFRKKPYECDLNGRGG